MQQRRLLLGSQSKWRRMSLEEVLSDAVKRFSSDATLADQLPFVEGITVGQWAPDIDEKAIRHPDPEQLVLAVGRGKMAAVIDHFGGSVGAQQSNDKAYEWYLVGDQVAVYYCKGEDDPMLTKAESRHVGKSSDGRTLIILEKPETEDENRLFLHSYSNYSITTIASLALYHVPTGRTFEGIDTNTVHFGTITEAVMDALIGRGDSMKCAGGFVVEDESLSKCITHIDGSIQGVCGLGPEVFMRLLKESQQPSGSKSNNVGIVMGSSSKGRLAVLKETLATATVSSDTVSATLAGKLNGITITQWSPEIDEKAIRDPNPEVLVTKVALAKMEAVKAHFAADNNNNGHDYENEWYLTGDQVVVYYAKGSKPSEEEDPVISTFEGRRQTGVVDGKRLVILEKPETIEENRLLLRAYSNHSATTVACSVLYHVPTKKAYTVVDRNTVHFGPIADDVVERVIGRGDSMKCAGGFVVEDEELSKIITRIDGSMQGVRGLKPELLLGMMAKSVECMAESSQTVAQRKGVVIL